MELYGECCTWFHFINWMAPTLTGLFDLRWFLSGWVAVYFGVSRIVWTGHLASCLGIVFCFGDGGFYTLYSF